MGSALLRLAPDMGLAVVAPVSRRGLADGFVAIAPERMGSAPDFDVAVDFSLPEAFDAVLALCLDRRVPLVSGTTGLDTAQKEALAAAATSIPVVWAANFSLGVAVLSDLVERAARMLADWDCDIVESHHVHKKDAPSGTALALGHRAHAGGASARYASLRAGDIVGEHTVQFAAAGERIELIHRATNRDIFARGALHVARQVIGRPPGAYAVADLLG
jgi:4-hydroxy-tetrahydrodipicolinate reductase